MLHTPPATGDPVVCYSLFPCELSFVVGFHKQHYQNKSIVTQQEIVVLPPPGVQGMEAQGAILDLLPQLSSVKNLCI